MSQTGADLARLSSSSQAWSWLVGLHCKLQRSQDFLVVTYVQSHNLPWTVWHANSTKLARIQSITTILEGACCTNAFVAGFQWGMSVDIQSESCRDVLLVLLSQKRRFKTTVCFCALYVSSSCIAMSFSSFTLDELNWFYNSIPIHSEKTVTFPPNANISLPAHVI